MDRSRPIPHVRDIFCGKQDLCLYDHSPRSRRRRIESRSIENENWKSRSSNNTPQNNNRNYTIDDSKNKNDSKASYSTKTVTDDESKVPYSTKTLTDRDIRHLERHLSMKKTIRKQISRNLAQAFIEDPQILDNQTTPIRNAERSVTLTRAKMAKSEQPFLDMLKDRQDDTDSGHSSPTRNGDYSEDEEESKRAQKDIPDSNKFSFWKMFSGKKKR